MMVTTRLYVSGNWMTKGLRVVSSDKSITSQNTSEYLYTSEALSPIIYKKVTGKIVLDAFGNGQDIFSHDLGYPPIVIAYMNPTISIVNSPNVGGGPYYPMPDSWGLMDNKFAFVYSYDYNVRLYVQSSSGSIHAGKTIKYVAFILVEPNK